MRDRPWIWVILAFAALILAWIATILVSSWYAPGAVPLKYQPNNHHDKRS